MGIGSLEKHEELKHLLAANPEIVGLKQKAIVRISLEVPLIKDNVLIAKPDIVVDYEVNKKLYIEVKSSDHPRAIEKLNNQLERIVGFIQEKGIDGKVLGVYRNVEGKIIQFAYQQKKIYDKKNFLRKLN